MRTETCGACNGTGRTRWYGQPITCAWCDGTGAATVTPHRLPVVLASCMDCRWLTSHTTRTAALAAIEAHQVENLGHRDLIGDNDGWHRAQGVMPADFPAVESAVFSRPES